MVRTGVLSREEGIERIEPKENQTMVSFAKEELEK